MNLSRSDNVASCLISRKGKYTTFVSGTVISDSHSMQLNGLKDFVFHNIGNKRNNEYEQ